MLKWTDKYLSGFIFTFNKVYEEIQLSRFLNVKEEPKKFYIQIKEKATMKCEHKTEWWQNF